MRLPSGDQAGHMWSVRVVGELDRVAAVRAHDPDLGQCRSEEVKAIRLPSGDQAAAQSSAGSFVSRTEFEPSASTT